MLIAVYYAYRISDLMLIAQYVVPTIPIAIAI